MEHENNEEDWEAILDLDLNRISLSTEERIQPSSSYEKKAPLIQRGRGAFRYGSSSMYSDHLDEVEKYEECRISPNDFELETNLKTESDPDFKTSRLGTPSSIAFSGHILEAYDIPLHVKTVHLENSFPSFLKDGWRIKWVDDSHALLIFSSLEKAKQALKEDLSLSFKLKLFTAESEIAEIEIKDYDLSPSIPRPATNSRSAHRMVVNALNHSLGKSHSSDLQKSKEEKDREASRKNRIAMRQKLRQSAWGED